MMIRKVRKINAIVPLHSITNTLRGMDKKDKGNKMIYIYKYALHQICPARSSPHGQENTLRVAVRAFARELSLQPWRMAFFRISENAPHRAHAPRRADVGDAGSPEKISIHSIPQPSR